MPLIASDPGLADRLALRLPLVGGGGAHHPSPLHSAMALGWRRVVVNGTFPDVSAAMVAEVRRLAGDGLTVVSDGRGTGSWVASGRRRLQALDAARDQLRFAVDLGATAVVLGCGADLDQVPTPSAWDQLAAGVIELACQAELDGVMLAVDVACAAQGMGRDVADVLLAAQASAPGLRLGVDLTEATVGEEVPAVLMHLAGSVSWVRTPRHGATTRELGGLFTGAIVEVACWDGGDGPIPAPPTTEVRQLDTLR